MERVFNSMESSNRICGTSGFVPQNVDDLLPEAGQETSLMQGSAAVAAPQRRPTSMLASVRQGFARVANRIRRSDDAIVQPRAPVQPRIFPWNNLTEEARRRLPSHDQFSHLGIFAYTPPVVLMREACWMMTVSNHPLGRDYRRLLPAIPHDFHVPDGILERHMAMEKQDAVNHNTILLIEAMARSTEPSPRLGRYTPQVLLGWVLSAADDLDRDNRLKYLKDAIACAMDHCSEQTLLQAHTFFKDWNVQPFSRFVSLTPNEVIDFLGDLCNALNEKVCGSSSGQPSASHDGTQADSEQGAQAGNERGTQADGQLGAQADNERPSRLGQGE
jgi:hypothetical protein